MSKSGKWIHGIDAGGPVGAAAAAALKTRFRTVRRRTAEIAERGAEVELVHQLRVASRRANAALELYRDLFRKKQRRRLQKGLTKLRDAAGDLRDRDVLLTGDCAPESPARAAFHSHVQQERRRAEPQLVELCQQFHGDDRFRRRARRLVKRLRRADAGPARDGFATWASNRLQELATDFFDEQPDDLHNIEALHQFRIAGKHLRYGIELVADGLPEPLRMEIYPLLEQLQERLGTIHDCAEQQRLWVEWLKGSNRDDAAAEISRSEHDSEARVRRLVDDFIAWWTPEAVSRLKARTASVLKPADDPNPG